MRTLGTKKGWETECFWKLRGGDFRLSHTNADTGAEVEYIMRCNERDELEFVRHVQSDGAADKYDVVAKFGNAMGLARLAADWGYAALDAERSVRNWSLQSAEPHIESFSAYDNYTVYGALYPVGATPTSAQVMADAPQHGFVSQQLGMGKDVVSVATLSAMHDGAALPATLLKFAAVSAVPQVSFLLADTWSVDALQPVTQTSARFTMSFQNADLGQLSPADQSIFKRWLTQQLMEAARARGFQYTSIELAVSGGGATADVTVPTADSASMLAAVLSDPVAPQEPVPLSTPLDVGTVSTTLESSARVGVAPTIVFAVETGSDNSSMTVAYHVSGSGRVVTKLYALATTAEMPMPVLPSSIKGDAAAVTFTLSAESGSMNVPIDVSARVSVYLVAENDEEQALLNDAYRLVSEPFLMTTDPVFSEGVLLGVDLADPPKVGHLVLKVAVDRVVLDGKHDVSSR